ARSRREEKGAGPAPTANRVAALERAYPRVILGCGNFGGIGSAPAFFEKGETPEQALELMDAAWEAGLTWVDTADAYGGGRSGTHIREGDPSRPPGGPPVTTQNLHPPDQGPGHRPA